MLCRRRLFLSDHAHLQGDQASGGAGVAWYHGCCHWTLTDNQAGSHNVRAAKVGVKLPSSQCMAGSKQGIHSVGAPGTAVSSLHTACWHSGYLSWLENLAETWGEPDAMHAPQH